MNHPNTPMAAHLWDRAKTNSYAMNMEPPITFLGLLLKGNCAPMLRVSELIQKENPSYEELAELGTLVRLGIIEYQARGGNGDSFLGEAFLVLGRTGRNPRRHRRRDLENMEDLPNA